MWLHSLVVLGTPNRRSLGISASFVCSLVYFLLPCWVQPWYEDLWLVLSHLFMPSLVDIPGRPDIFWGEMKEQWIWGRRMAVEALGEVECRERGCSEEMLYEERINQRKKHKEILSVLLKANFGRTCMFMLPCDLSSLYFSTECFCFWSVLICFKFKYCQWL